MSRSLTGYVRVLSDASVPISVTSAGISTPGKASNVALRSTTWGTYEISDSGTLTIISISAGSMRRTTGSDGLTSSKVSAKTALTVPGKGARNSV